MHPTTHDAAVQVRAATRADLAAIAALHTGARAASHRARFPDTPFDVPAEHAREHEAWSRVLERGGTPALCAARHGTVVGAASYRHRDGHRRPAVTLHQLHVDPRHWGTGIGRALHTACLGPGTRPVSPGRSSTSAGTTTAPVPSTTPWAGAPTRSAAPPRTPPTSP